jgi:K+-transporting ATPase KdpF subunit
MVVGRRGVLSRKLGPHAVAGPLTFGGLTMAWTTGLAMVVALFLIVYLIAALLKPEIFS